MKNNIVDFAKKLISIPSTKESPQAIKTVLALAEGELRDYAVEKFEKDNAPSLLFYNTSSKPKKFKIILNAHLDVVPAKKEQFSPHEKKDRLFGRGAMDMKSATAVMIFIFKELSHKLEFPLGLQLVTDEETGGFAGTKYQIEKGVRADFVVAGEPTGFGVNNKAKGIIWARIKTRGKTAHGAYIWNGQNAIWNMHKVLSNIQKMYPVPKSEVWKTTINIANIESTNKTFNKVPDDCGISLDVRYIPEDTKTIMNSLKSVLDSNSELEILVNEPAQFTDKKNPFVRLLRSSTKKVTGKPAPVVLKHGGSDIRHFNRVGSSGVTFGPIGEGLHTDKEWVDIKSLELYYLILKDFLLAL